MRKLFSQDCSGKNIGTFVLFKKENKSFKEKHVILKHVIVTLKHFELRMFTTEHEGPLSL